MVSVSWTDAAICDLDVLDSVIAKRVVEKVFWLGENFSSIVPGQLHYGLRGLFKLRVGDYRVVYSLANEGLVVEAVKHRREVYQA